MARNNVPAPPAPLLGREAELENVRALLLRPDVRLVTLTGPAGVGKTRLALALLAAAAGDFPDGVYFVDLAPLAHAAHVAAAALRAVGREAGDADPPLDGLIRALRHRRALLALDNFEHVLAAAPDVAALLAGCPEVRVIATSRVRLHLRWEHEVPVPPLPVPEPYRPAAPPRLADVLRVPSARLFVDRARAVRPDLPLEDSDAAVIVEICRCLDGLPLAIELAAGRADVASPEEILTGLRQGRLDQLTQGPVDLPPRQRTLRDAIAWSYTLLSVAEQTLFRQLAVFAGGFTPDGAAAVCDFGLGKRRPMEQRASHGAPSQSTIHNPQSKMAVPEGLAALIRKSLLRRVGDESRPERFTMLETVREFAAERLGAVDEREAAAARRRHAYYYLALAEQAEAGLLGTESAAWLAQLEREYANLRAALEWAVSHRAAATGLRLATALFWFWHWHGRPAEGRAWLNRLLAGAPRQAAALRSRALIAAGALAHLELDYAAARTLLEQALALARQAGARAETAMALSRLGYLALHQEDEPRTAALLGESLDLHRALGRPAQWGTALALAELGGLALRRRDVSRARSLCAESLDLFRDTGSPWGIAHALHGVGQVALEEREYERARAAYDERLAISRQLGNLADVAHSLEWLGAAARLQGDTTRALANFEEALAVRTEWNDRWGFSFCLQELAHLAAGRNPALALRLAGAAAAELAARGNPHLDRELARLESEFAATRHVLGSAAVRAWQAGRALAPDAAAAEALATLRRDQPSAAAAVKGSEPAATPPRGGSATVPRVGLVPTLTPREREVATLVAAGLTNREIAARLMITDGTAGSHVEHILTKLGLRSRAQIAAWAVGRGLTTSPAA